MYWTRLNSAQPHWSQLPIPTHLAQMQSNLCLYNICLHSHCLCNPWLCNLCSLTQLQKTKAFSPKPQAYTLKINQIQACMDTNLPNLCIPNYKFDTQLSHISGLTDVISHNPNPQKPGTDWGSSPVGKYSSQVQNPGSEWAVGPDLESGSGKWVQSLDPQVSLGVQACNPGSGPSDCVMRLWLGNSLYGLAVA